MSKFAFYDELERFELPASESLEKRYHVISDMNNEQMEILAALMIHYLVKTGQQLSGSNVEKIYSAKKTAGKGRIFQVKSLPDGLQKIILAYLLWLR